MAVSALVPRRTLVDAVFPRPNLALQAGLVLAASVLVAASARLSINLTGGVPITAQTYAVLLIGALLGSRRGAAALLAYLGEGLAGLPVFAAGTDAWTPSTFPGLPVIVGPTAGYLFAFPIAAFVVGALAERGWDRRIIRAIVAMTVGEVIIYLGGVPWLAHLIGWSNAITYGVNPFIGGDVAKMLLAAATLPGGWKLMNWLEKIG